MPPAPAIGAAALLLLVLALAPRGALAQTTTATASPTPSVSITPSATQTPQITFVPGSSLCSDTVILGSSTDYAVLAAGDALNTLGVDVIVARPDTCTKLSKSSGTLRCSPSTFQFTDPATGLVMKYVGKAGSEIPIGAATTKSGTAVPATAGAVAAGAPLVLTSNLITIECTTDAPTHARPVGSLCINLGGNSTSTRLYISTNAGGTWTNITTAA